MSRARFLPLLVAGLVSPSLALAETTSTSTPSTATSTAPRARVEAQVPADPLAVPKEIQARIGSDYDGPPQGSRYDGLSRSYFPYYEEVRGSSRLRTLPPLFLERTRNLPMPGSVSSTPDTEGLYGLLYYRRRSETKDRDVVFPLFWHLRDGDARTVVAGPFVHRESTFEHDNWLAPLFFEGERADGGYFHAPALLTFSQWDSQSAFTLAGPYYRSRTGSDVDWGLFPFLFRGGNGDATGNLKEYTLIPPALFYSRYRELDDSRLVVAGPVVYQTDLKRTSLTVAPLFHHIRGRPDVAGIDEQHTTLFPFFHYGYTPSKSLLATPLFVKAKSPTSDTLVTPLYSKLVSRSTTLTLAGPLLPVFASYTDSALGSSAWGAFPFFYRSKSPRGSDWLTPVFGRFETYGVETTYWAFPSLTYTDAHDGWSARAYPIFFAGKSAESSHNVIAPIYWDFSDKKKRTTIGFPLFWRFADHTDGTITQVALNTLYREKRVSGGKEWSFHFLPVFGFGGRPEGYWWDLVFGLAGYEKAGSQSRVKVLWAPFDL